MKESGALLAGEMSGHIFFKEAGMVLTMDFMLAPGCWSF